MFERILVLTDFSAYAHKFLECIGDLPEVKDVVILNVVSKDPHAKTWDPAAKASDAERKLAKDKKIVKAPGVNVKVRAVSVTGEDIITEIPMAIQKVANEENVSLVVMGARGKSFIQSVLLGSMTRNLLRSGDKHLLIMRYKMAGGSGSVPVGAHKSSVKVAEPPKGPEMLEKFGDKILSKVLIPTDFSQPADAAFTAVRNMKGVGEIVLLHVVSKGESKEEIDAAVNQAAERLNRISKEPGNGGIKVTPRVAVGTPTEVIRSMAEEEDVSMIALSSVGENALRVGKIGNVTYDVANTANRPVLVVRLKMVYNYIF
jgi:nucleotide-binding universal stress UspA family protein